LSEERFEDAQPVTQAPAADQAPQGQPITPTGATALAVRNQPPPLMKLWESASTQQKMQALIPKELSHDKFKRLVVSLLYRQPELSECDPVSVFSCISDCATMGMYPDVVSGKVYFIARWNKKLKRKVCTILVGFKGLRDLALQSPEILDIWPGVVREGDEFSMIRAPRQEIHHKPEIRETGQIIGFYSCAALKSGLTSFDWLPLSKVEETRDRAFNGLEQWQKDQSPWTSYFEEMGKKTAIRRHFKSLPLTETAREAAEAEEKTEERAIRNVTPEAEAGTPEPQAEPTGRPTVPPRRGGAKAAAASEPSTPETPSQEPAGEPQAEPAKPAPEPEKPPQTTPPVSTPAPTRRRAAAATGAPTAPPPSAETPPPPPPRRPSYPQIAPGVTYEGFHGKAWPQVIVFELLEITPKLVNGIKPYLAMKVKVGDKFTGDVCAFEGAGLAKDKTAMVAKPFLQAGAMIEATFEAQGRAKVDPATGDQVADYSRPPALMLRNLAPANEPAF
jgi:recombination protein RecT